MGRAGWGAAIADTATLLQRGFAVHPASTAGCLQTLESIAAARRYPVQLGLFDGLGRRICALPGLSPLRAVAPVMGVGTEVRVINGPDVLRFGVGGLPGGLVAIGELPPHHDRAG